MSWFDASGFANLAKSALKEAQKTIDKALDIKEEELRASEARVIDDTNFFATWGLKNESTTIQPTSSTSKQDASIWGSFTGSFFESQKNENDSENVAKRSESFDEQINNDISESRSMSPSISLPDRLARLQIKENPKDEKNELQEDDKIQENQLQVQAVEDLSGIEFSKREQKIRPTEMVNRVSIISPGSDKKSSESVEILGSRSETNTDCTTTPDSEIVSGSHSSNSLAVNKKRNSESVEIIPDSLVTSPSSVEVLEDHSESDSTFLLSLDHHEGDEIINEPDSETQDYSSDISPYSSPMCESKSLMIDDLNNKSDELSNKQFIQATFSNEKSCTSLEGIQNTDELDEISQAEDSYTSASESTTVMTVMESTYQGNQQGINSDNPDSLKDVKQSLHLVLEPTTIQTIRKAENLMGKLDTYDSDFVKSTTIEPPDLDTTENSSVEQFSGTMLTDSSCEGTLIETSSEDNAIFKQNIQTQDSKTEDIPLTSSSYVKNMLAEAMVEKGEMIAELETQEICVPPREHSPISSESRSDLVKIGSDQASGHTSGDELETATSSDIEIISRYSPNGDSSSTQSRQSPANLPSIKAGDLLTKTLKTRGHSRELSEISISSDAASLEIEKLLKRIREMNEILEVRESKLIDVSRMNMELHDQNNHLKMQLESWEKRGQQHQDLNVITDEYTQRMSALENKFQQSIRERDILKDQLEILKKDMSSQSSAVNAEKDEVIKQLREEGEKLSKQQLQHSNIIKKLRAKEKENDAIIKSQKEHLEEQNTELERLKRSLNAKEDVERTQIEAVHTLTARVKKQEREINLLQENLDNTLHKMNAYKTSLDAAKLELTETKLNCNTAEEELKRALDNAGESCRLMAQVEDLMAKLRQSEETHVKHVNLLKQENNDLLKRLESAEGRNEELSESISVVTKPLLRQIEQLQSNLAHKTSTFMKQEKLMSEKIDELQTNLASIVSTDRSLIEENLNLKSKIASIESQMKRKETERNEMEEECKIMKMKNDKLMEESEELGKMLKNMEQSHQDEMKKMKREIESLGDKLSVEKAAIDAEKRKNHPVLEQQQSVGDDARMSPTSSVRRDSISSTNSVWLAFNDSVFDTSSGRFPSVYDGLRTSTNTTSSIETLQAQLKAREGEIQTLQWEISRRNNERDALNMELSSLSMKVEELSMKLMEMTSLNANLNEIQTRYDALLQMYGEKVEETEELRLDLEDVKDMYKTQIDQLLKRDT